jgi:Domain of unknown function (DUF4294)
MFYKFKNQQKRMKSTYFILFFILISFVSQSQVNQKDTEQMGYELTEYDTIHNDTIKLPEVIVSRSKLDPEAKKQFLLLQNRVYRTYPYAKLAAERLTALNKGMDNLTNARDKKMYFKIVENYLTNEFEEKLKKLSRKQGQILVKLIHRQTGVSTFYLIKNLKSGWKAFWSNTAASLFDINLKEEYRPFDSNEDYLIETILTKAFETGKLPKQAPAVAIDFELLDASWKSKKG